MYVCVCVCVCVVCLDWLLQHFGLLGGSTGQESDCNAVDSGLIVGWLSSPGEGIGNPLQYSWAFLVAQLIKNMPAMRKTWV